MTIGAPRCRLDGYPLGLAHRLGRGHRLRGSHRHASDQGRQYAVRDHVDLLSDAGVVISLSDSGALTQNALVERFIRTLKDEHLPYSEYGSLADMLHQLK